jgi:exonuclease III
LHDLQSYDIVCLTETRHIDHTALELYFPGHDVYHRAATRSVRGMGVATLVSKRLRPSVRAVTSPDPALQLVIVTLHPPATPLPVTIINCYIPPLNSPQLEHTSQQDYFQHLTQLCQQHSGNLLSPAVVIVGGDLNAHVSFAAPAAPASSHGDVAGGLLVDLARNCELNFCVQHDVDTCPTFHTNFGSNGPVSSCPDHVLMSTNLPATVTSSVRLDMPGSDHRPIAINIDWTAAQPVPSAHLHTHYPNGRLRWQGRESDYCTEVLRAIDSSSFEEFSLLLQNPDVDTTTVASMFDDLVRFAGVRSGHYTPPNSQTRVLPIPKPVVNQPWFDTECQQARYHYKLCLRNLPFGHATLRAAAREYQNMRRRKQREWSKNAVVDLVDQAHHDPRAFWKRFARSQQPAPACTSAPDMDACISVLQTVFVSDAQPSNSQPPGHLTDLTDHQLNQPFSEHEVEQTLASLKNSRSCGPDGIPAEFLKYCVRRDESGKVQEYLLAPYLTKLFNHCFDVGRVPDHWCTALLSLVYKKGDKLDWNNYRPLAVTQVVAKVYALLLHKRLTRWAEGQQLLTPAQAGFRPGYSTTMNNFILLHFIHKYRRLSQPLYACFLDLSKAYDRVVRQHVWDRLHGFGCRGKLLFAVASLYTNLTYSVKFQNGASAPFHTNSGLRQGCPLSPFLFNVIIQKLWEIMQDLCPDTGPAIAAPANAMHANPGNGSGAATGAPSSAFAAPAAPGAAPGGPGHHNAVMHTVPAVMFADDVKYMAYTPRHSQRQLHATVTCF